MNGMTHFNLTSKVEIGKNWLHTLGRLFFSSNQSERKGSWLLKFLFDVIHTARSPRERCKSVVRKVRSTSAISPCWQWNRKGGRVTHVVLRDRKPAAAAPVLDYPVCAILAKKEVGVLLVECVERCSLLSSQESSSRVVYWPPPLSFQVDWNELLPPNHRYPSILFGWLSLWGRCAWPQLVDSQGLVAYAKCQ